MLRMKWSFLIFFMTIYFHVETTELAGTFTVCREDEGIKRKGKETGEEATLLIMYLIGK